MNPELTVVIPTVGRPGVLERCLDCLAAQTLDHARFETLVIIDGDDLASERVVEQTLSRTDLDIRCETQSAAGPATARNRSIDLARADIIDFINDDILLEPGNLTEHMRIHQERPGHGVRGDTYWHEDVQQTAFRKWLAVVWGQHADLIRDPDDIGYEFFHTCDLSVHRRWYDKDRFSLDFPNASLEDTELGWRLCEKGLKLVWAQEARSLHCHEYDLCDFYDKARVNGRSAVILVDKIPELRHRVIGHFAREAQWRRRLRLVWLRTTGRGDTPAYWQGRHDLLYIEAVKEAGGL